MTSPFVFTPLTEDDLPFLLEIRNECRDSLHDNREFILPECRAWFRETRPEFYLVRHDGKRIGYFRTSNRDAASRSIYVGADLHPDFRGLGLARPAYAAFFVVLRIEQGVSVVTLEVLSHNTVAYGLYLKLGFTEIERTRAVAVRGGRLVDSIVMLKSL